jgi:hypothetical protein
MWYEFDLTPVSASHVRVLVTETNQFGNKFAAMIAEIEVIGAQSSKIQAILSWNATGDNMDQGTAASYQVEYDTTDTFPAPTTIPGAPAPPQTAGLPESMTASNLPGESTLYFRVIAFDEAGLSSTSNTSNALVTPGIPPAAITDLVVTTVDEDSVQFDFTTVGDDGNEVGTTATSYDFRYATAPILTQADFDLATPVPGPVDAPVACCSNQTIQIDGLPTDTTLHFAGVVSDEAGNDSAVSNSASAKTGDIVPPDTISDLAAAVVSSNYSKVPAVAASASSEVSPFFPSNAIDEDLNTFWGAQLAISVVQEQITFDLGGVHDISRVRMHPRLDTTAAFPRDFQIQVSTDNVSFATVHTENDFVPASADWQTFDFAATSAQWIRVLVTETAQFGNRRTTQIAEFEAYELLPPSIELAWTAVGENGAGSTGAAQSYEIRSKTSAFSGPIDATVFAEGTIVSGTPGAPKAPGMPETFVVSGLPAGTHHFAIMVTDENGNPNYSNPSASAVQP